MATTITVLNNQSIKDLAIQHTGLVKNSFDIALYNGLSISDELAPGTEIVIPDDLEIDIDVVDYFVSKGLQPSTSILSDLIVIKPLGGIGYWEIENEFIVD